MTDENHVLDSAQASELLQGVLTLHLYRNENEWFVAASLEAAIEVAREWQSAHCGLDDEEVDLELRQEPDDKPMTLEDEDDGTRQTLTCAEWAAQHGAGFFTSLEF